MKVLYAIQGTGNGHMARAEDVVPVLRRYADVDLFVSGAQCDIPLPYEVKYKSSGLGFYFGKRGGVDLIKTIRKNRSGEAFRMMREFPVWKYDLVVNDFEPVSAWAARLRNVPCVALSHQASLLSAASPRPDHYDPVGSWILKHYAPANAHVGFHFRQFDSNMFTPVIRKAVRTLLPVNNGHYTVYLPAYDDRKLLPLLLAFPEIHWQVFSKHNKIPFRLANIDVRPVNNAAFTASLASCEGILCGAGFETPAEAMYLGKKLMVVPMKKQFEQFCNAAALEAIGIPVLAKMKKKSLGQIALWLDSGKIVKTDYPDIVETAVLHALSMKEKILTPSS